MENKIHCSYFQLIHVCHILHSKVVFYNLKIYLAVFGSEWVWIFFQSKNCWPRTLTSSLRITDEFLFVQSRRKESSDICCFCCWVAGEGEREIWPLVVVVVVCKGTSSRIGCCCCCCGCCWCVLRWPGWVASANFLSRCSPRSILLRSSGLDMDRRMLTGSRWRQRLHSSSSFLHLSGFSAHRQPFLEPFVGFSIFSKHLFSDRLCRIEFFQPSLAVL